MKTGRPDKRRRAQQLLSLLREQDSAGIREMASLFDVSEMTIRRDLDRLAAEGKIIRTHGGAATAERVSFEFAFLERQRAQRKEKLAIARRAAGLVSPGVTVILDSGTTTLAVAETLRRIRPLRVITTSLPIAAALQFTEDVDVLLLGGLLRAGAPDLEGALTESNLEELRADLAFIGADGIDRKGGVYNDSLGLARMLGKMAQTAEKVYVVADRSKLGRRALKRFGNLAAWNGLITDCGADRSFTAALRRAGVSVMLAKDPSNPGEQTGDRTDTCKPRSVRADRREGRTRR